MEHFERTWNFVCENREYLDCELVSAKGTFLTNKCFLFSIKSSLFLGLSCSINTEGNLKIIMNEFSEEEVRREMKGFVIFNNAHSRDEDDLKLPEVIGRTTTNKASIHPKTKYSPFLQKFIRCF